MGMSGEAPATADLVDRYRDGVQSCSLQLHSYGARRRFIGPIRTVRTRDDNALIRDLVAAPGAGAVLVVDGGGSLRTALLGGGLAARARANGWAGVVIWGAVRDVAELAAIDLGIKALGSNPALSAKAGTGAIDVPVSFGDATFHPGWWLCADEDGVIARDAPLP